MRCSYCQNWKKTAPLCRNSLATPCETATRDSESPGTRNVHRSTQAARRPLPHPPLSPSLRLHLLLTLAQRLHQEERSSNVVMCRILHHDDGREEVCSERGHAARSSPPCGPRASTKRSVQPHDHLFMWDFHKFHRHLQSAPVDLVVHGRLQQEEVEQ